MTSRPLVLLALASLFGLGIPVGACAADASGALAWDSGFVVGTSRMWRGQQQTDGKPAISAEVKVSLNGAYAGIWAANADLGPGTDTSAEIDYFAGWGRRFGSWTVNAGYLYRQRPSDTMSLDFQELTASAVYDFGVVRTGLGVYYSWDYFQGGKSLYSYGNLRVPFGTIYGMQVTGSIAAGHYDFSHGAVGDYNDMDLRLIARRGSFQWSLGFSDTDIKPSQSGLLTRNRTGARARAELLVMF